MKTLIAMVMMMGLAACAADDEDLRTPGATASPTVEMPVEKSDTTEPVTAKQTLSAELPAADAGAEPVAENPAAACPPFDPICQMKAAMQNAAAACPPFDPICLMQATSGE